MWWMWGTRTLGLHRLTRVPVLLMKSTAFGLREGGLRHAGLLSETCDPIIAPLSAACCSCGYSVQADVNTGMWKGWAVKYRHLADIEQTTMHPLFSTGAGLSCCPYKQQCPPTVQSLARHFSLLAQTLRACSSSTLCHTTGKTPCHLLRV